MNIAQKRSFSDWVQPWDKEDFNDLYNRDDRFFSILIKGALAWLTKNIVLYSKPVKHFIFNTGSSYMYVETNGYKFSWSETSGEDQVYMERPRCIVNLGDFQINQEELTQPYVRAVYERLDENNMRGFNAEFRRIPFTLSLDLHYIMSTFNEQIILMQEIIDKMIFQKYFSIVYLGQVIKCSIEFPSNLPINLKQIDMASPEVNNKELTVSVNICGNYPAIDTKTEIPTDQLIRSLKGNVDMYYNQDDDHTYDRSTLTVD